MKKGEVSKNRIIEAAALLFWEKGYHAASMNDILEACHLPKGSFYFYFSSKKELLSAAAVYYRDAVLQMFRDAADGRQWKEFVTAFCGRMREKAEKDSFFGCPFAFVGQEIAFSEPDAADMYYEPLRELQGIFQTVLCRSKVPYQEAVRLSDRMLSCYMGYIVRYRIGREAGILSAMENDLKALYDEWKGYS